MNPTFLLLATVSMFRMGGDIAVTSAPDGAVLRTMGGDIRVSRGAGKIIAKTMGGDIEIETLEGSADAGTMGGEIRVTVPTAAGRHDLNLHSMGGDIVVTLPHDFEGDFLVELEEGDDHQDHKIISDFPLQQRESTRWRVFGFHRPLHIASGRTGTGANRVSVSTIGSNITIRRK